MINLDKIKAELFNEVNLNYTYSGTEPDANNIYANNCLDESIDWVKKNFKHFTSKSTVILKSDSKEVRKQKIKNRKENERKAREDVYNNTPRPKPSGFIATITFGVLAMWVLQATVGWIVSRLFNKIYSEDVQVNDIKTDSEENLRII